MSKGVALGKGYGAKDEIFIPVKREKGDKDLC